MKKSILTVTVFLLAAIIMGCSGGSGMGIGNKTPKEIATEFCNCWEKEDIDKFVDLLLYYMPSQQKKELEEGFEEEYKTKKDAEKEIKESVKRFLEKDMKKNHGYKFEAENEEIDGDEASVSIKRTDKDGNSEIISKMKFIKEDGKWKMEQ